MHRSTPSTLSTLFRRLVSLMVGAFSLEGALATARELGLPRGGLEGVLRRRLFVVASMGINDPEALRNEALKEMDTASYLRSRPSQRGEVRLLVLTLVPITRSAAP